MTSSPMPALLHHTHRLCSARALRHPRLGALQGSRLRPHVACSGFHRHFPPAQDPCNIPAPFSPRRRPISSDCLRLAKVIPFYLPVQAAEAGPSTTAGAGSSINTVLPPDVAATQPLHALPGGLSCPRLHCRPHHTRSKIVSACRVSGLGR